MIQFRPMRISAAMISRGTAALLLFLAGNTCFSQTPAPLGQGTPVTGQCQGHTTQPGCVIPNLFGPTGLSLFAQGAFPHYAHFIGAAQDTLNQSLSTSIATQLAILPIISPASGFTYKYDSAAGAFVRSTTSFGPIYTERAETIGRGKVSFGVSYQRFRFNSLDGVNLHNVPAVFSHLPEQPFQTFEADVIKTTNNIDLNMDQTMLYGTVGLTDRLDVSVALPIVSVRMGASSNALIERVSGPTFVLAGTNTTFPNPHQFTADPNSLTNTYTSTGSASGLGDVTFRIKGNVLRSGSVGVALALDVRTPTGDARQFLGSGATGIKPFVAVSLLGRRFSPHLNFGYQWNGDSILAGNLTGTTFGEDSAGNATVLNGPSVKGSLPGVLFYSAGADYGATRSLTLVFDYLGQTLFNSPRVFETTTTTLNIPGGTGALTLPTISGGRDDVGLNSGAVGFKYNLFGKLLLTADVLFRLDNKGLRQDVTPLIALSYAFGGQ